VEGKKKRKEYVSAVCVCVVSSVSFYQVKRSLVISTCLAAGLRGQRSTGAILIAETHNLAVSQEFTLCVCEVKRKSACYFNCHLPAYHSWK